MQMMATLRLAGTGVGLLAGDAGGRLERLLGLLDVVGADNGARVVAGDARARGLLFDGLS